MSVSCENKLEYYRDGFTKVEKFFSKEDMVELEREYKNFVDVEAPNLTGRDINYCDKEKKVLNSIHCLSIRPGAYFYELLHSDRMRALAAEFLRDGAKGRKSEMFAKPGGFGLKSPFHQDEFYWTLRPARPGTALTLWVAFDHCSAENGGISYLKESHTVGVIQHVNSFAPGSSQMIDDKDFINSFEHVTPVAEPGDILVHDSMTIHYSKDNKSDRSRRGMTLQYDSKDAVVDKDMADHYESQLARQVTLREQSGSTSN